MGWWRALEGLVLCRGCLGDLDGRARAGLCGRCWSMLGPLGEDRCPRCALDHGWGDPCADPVAWDLGDALWAYHGGPGPLLLPGIKRGELGWKRELLERARRAPLPVWAREAGVVCSAPTAGFRRWLRGFDLAEDAGRMFAERLGVPFRRVLRKPFFAPAQTGLPRGLRRRMGARVGLIPGQGVSGAAVLLVDDVWTTGTTLLRCAQALTRAGASRVAVLALFRAQRRG